MGSFRGEAGATGVVVEIDGQKGGLVTEVDEAEVVEVVKAGDESVGATEEGDEGRGRVGYEAGRRIISAEARYAR